jgi:hypothetical protein
MAGARAAAQKDAKEPLVVTEKDLAALTATRFAFHGWDVVVFGSAPNPHAVEWTYEGGSAARLAKICGKRLTWFNLFAEEPTRWSREEARESATQWCEALQRKLPRVPLILLGSKVCDAFGIEDPDWLETYASILWSPMIAFPHPSGLNRWWNDPENEREAFRVGHAVASNRYFKQDKNYRDESS